MSGGGVPVNLPLTSSGQLGTHPKIGTIGEIQLH